MAAKFDLQVINFQAACHKCHNFSFYLRYDELLSGTIMVQMERQDSRFWGVVREEHGNSCRRNIEETHVLQNAVGKSKQPGT